MRAALWRAADERTLVNRVKALAPARAGARARPRSCAWAARRMRASMIWPPSRRAAAPTASIVKAGRRAGPGPARAPEGRAHRRRRRPPHPGRCHDQRRGRRRLPDVRRAAPGRFAAVARHGRWSGRPGGPRSSRRPAAPMRRASPTSPALAATGAEFIGAGRRGLVPSRGTGDAAVRARPWRALSRAEDRPRCSARVVEPSARCSAARRFAAGRRAPSLLGSPPPNARPTPVARPRLRRLPARPLSSTALREATARLDRNPNDAAAMTLIGRDSTTRASAFARIPKGRRLVPPRRRARRAAMRSRRSA